MQSGLTEMGPDFDHNGYSLSPIKLSEKEVSFGTLVGCTEKQGKSFIFLHISLVLDFIFGKEGRN